MTDWRRVIVSMAPHAHPNIVSMIADHADVMFATHGITTVRRQACVLAHIAVETMSFTKLEENLNYSAKRLREVFPTHFTPAQAEACAHKPKAIAIRAYGGRMGNKPGTEDGWTYRGKGMWQLTGYDNTQALAKYLRIAPQTAAAWLTDPNHALECVCGLFHVLGVGPSADSGDVVAQTKKINGGKNGLDERKIAYRKAMQLLSAEAASQRVALVSNLEANDEPLPPEKTVHDLREDGSRTIKGADQAQRALVGALGSIGSATAVLDQTNGMVSSAQSAAATFQTSASYLTWAEGHWKILAIAGLSVLAAFFIFRVWQGARTVKLARVDDANSGANLARI